MSWGCTWCWNTECWNTRCQNTQCHITWEPLCLCVSMVLTCLNISMAHCPLFKHEHDTAFHSRALSLFHMGEGLFEMLYHGSTCCIYRTRTRFTKIYDFVPFGTCQDPVELFLTFFQKCLKFLTMKFLEPRALGKIWKKSKYFFLKRTQNFKGEGFSQLKRFSDC